MDELSQLWTEVNQHFFAVLEERSAFDRNIHKKYNAKYYYQVENDLEFVQNSHFQMINSHRARQTPCKKYWMQKGLN